MHMNIEQKGTKYDFFSSFFVERVGTVGSVLDFGQRGPWFNPRSRTLPGAGRLESRKFTDKTTHRHGF